MYKGINIFEKFIITLIIPRAIRVYIDYRVYRVIATIAMTHRFQAK